MLPDCDSYFMKLFNIDNWLETRLWVEGEGYKVQGTKVKLDLRKALLQSMAEKRTINQKCIAINFPLEFMGLTAH